MKTRVSNAEPACDLAGDNDLCVLVRPVLTAAAREVPPRASSAAGEEDDAEAPCITHVDRAMIRAYFRQTDSAPTRRFPDNPRADRKVPAKSNPGALPRDLEEKLSALPAGFMRRIAGTDVVLVEVASQAIIDLVADVDDPSLA